MQQLIHQVFAFFLFKTTSSSGKWFLNTFLVFEIQKSHHSLGNQHLGVIKVS